LKKRVGKTVYRRGTIRVIGGVARGKTKVKGVSLGRVGLQEIWGGGTL